MSTTQIQLRHITRSPALTARIRELTDKLEHHNPRITRCHVIVEAETHRSRKGKQYDVKVDVSVAGGPDCAVTRRHDEDVYVALRDAFHALERQLEPLHG